MNKIELKPGIQLKNLRKEYKLTQEQLANLAGMSQNAIASYESSKRKISEDVDLILSQILGVDSLIIEQEQSKLKSLENLVFYQKKLQLSNKDLAKKLGIDSPMLSRLLNGKRNPSKSMIKKIENLILNDGKEILMNIDQEDGTFYFPKVDKEELGKRIQEIRKNREESLEKFGENFSRIVGKNVVSRWEKGINTPDIDRLMNISYLGNTTATYLMYGDKYTTMLKKDPEFHQFSSVDRFYLGLRLRKIRKDYRMERTEFGKYFEPIITKWSMDRYENGKDIPNTERILQYAYIGKVSLEFLIYG